MKRHADRMCPCGPILLTCDLNKPGQNLTFPNFLENHPTRPSLADGLTNTQLNKRKNWSGRTTLAFYNDDAEVCKCTDAEAMHC